MRQIFTLGFLALLLAFAWVAVADDGGIKKSDVPEAVLKAFETSYPKAVATEYSKKTADGQTRYEIETRVGELEKDFVYLTDGTLFQIDEDMTVKSLPAAVVEAVKKAYPDGEIDEADKITKGANIEFEVMVEVGDTDYELLFSPDGKILTSASVDEDDDEPGDVDEADEEDDD